MRDAEKTPPEIRYEFPDPNPIEVPVRPDPAPNTLAKLLEQNRALQLQALAQQQIEESYEEADDFDVDDFNGALDYGQTKWEIAADAAQLTPHELFEKIYGVDHTAAYPKTPLDTRTPRSSVPDDSTGDDPPISQPPVAAPKGKKPQT